MYVLWRNIYLYYVDGWIEYAGWSQQSLPERIRMKSSKSRPWLAKMLTILSSPLLSPRWLSQSEFHGLQPPVINWQSYNQILNQQAVPCRQAPGNNSIIHRRLLITDTITVRPAQLSRLISPSDINCTIFLINLCLSHLQPEAYQTNQRKYLF